MTVTLLCGDTRTVTATLADGSVDLVCCSPPFLSLRSYLPAGHESKSAEIGSEANPAAYIDMLLTLTAEWGRVLAPHGSIAIELGDTYTGHDYATGGDQRGTGNLTFKTPDGKRTSPVRLKPGKDSGWPRPKSLALIPQLYAVALAYGINPLTGQASPAGRWLVRNVIVWHRPNPGVGALGDKVRPSTSYIVVATRSPKRWFDLTAVRTLKDLPPHTDNRGGHIWDDIPGRARQVMNPVDENGHRIQQNPAGAPPLDTWTDPYDGTHDTWTLTTQPSRLAHYAMWPAKLAERLILMMCPLAVCRVCGEARRRVERDNDDLAAVKALVGDKWTSGGLDKGLKRPNGADRIDVSGHKITLGWTDCGCVCSTCDGKGVTIPLVEGHPYGVFPRPCLDCPDGRAFRPGLVLDPFAGSGTTCAVADLHHRDAIGIDLDPRNHDLYPARYHEVKRALYGTPAPQPGQGVLAL